MTPSRNNLLHLTGIIPPLVTPLDPAGELDGAALARVVDRVIAGGASGLFVLGTTGEGPSLSQQQRRQVVSAACQAAAGRVPVLVGISDTSRDDALALAEHAASCGAAAVVAAAPYYFPLTQADLARYFVELAELSPLPLVLYNMPACVRTTLERSTLEACARSPKIIAVKDSSGDLAVFRGMLELKGLRPDWTFLIGPEHLLAEATQLGGDGGVSGGANLDPLLFVATWQAARRGDALECARLQQQIEQLGRIYRVGSDFMSVARGIKTALSVMGIAGETMAPPFSACDDSQRKAIEELVRTFFGERACAAVEC